MSGMDEDEVWDALEELYRDGDVEVIPGIGEDVDPAFSLTDSGVDRAAEVLQESDEVVMFLTARVLSTTERTGDSEVMASTLKDFGEWLRDNTGVNLFRVMQRVDGPTPVNAEDLPGRFVQQFDPEQ